MRTILLFAMLLGGAAPAGCGSASPNEDVLLEDDGADAREDGRETHPDGRDAPDDGPVEVDEDGRDGPPDADAEADEDGDDGVSPCRAGFADCNGNSGDGCEAELAVDPLNCGRCGHDCLGGGCAAGTCQPVVIGSPTGVSTDLHNGMIALGPDNVYFSFAGNPSGPGGVSMVGKDGTGYTCIACDTGSPRQLATDDTSVYWVDNGINQLRRAALDGTRVQSLWSGNVGSPIAVGGVHVYWYDTAGTAVMQANLDGSLATSVATGVGEVRSLAMDGEDLFWTTNAEVVQLELSTDSRTTLASGLSDARAVAADATHVYWATGPWSGTQVVQRRARSASGSVEDLATYGASDIALSDTHVYAAFGHGGEIWRMPKSGGSPEILAAGQPGPWSIAVDDQAVYWGNENDGTVSKLAL